jgi:UDP-N-acetylmuramoyl-L-alanyl-D-glutamate--2,6-diaminopimelate ligase
VRDLSPSRILTVFGCGGERDADKRPLMGEVAAELSDVVILTSDNPRGEDPESIADGAEEGIRRAAAGRDLALHRILDREKAIDAAIEMAQPGDAVVIAGKGHETHQILGEQRLPFDDREASRAALARRNHRG